MTSIASVSLSELRGRRITLRRKRRIHTAQAIWRTVASAGLASGLVWGATQPIWVIRTPDQIAVEGNEMISDRAVRSLLSLSYPQSLLRIEPQALASRLTSNASVIASATVKRQLIPPGLMVQVQERQPVALAIGIPSPGSPLIASRAKETPKMRSPVGLLDANGVLVPLEKYKVLGASFSLPKLKILGVRERDLAKWPQIYQVLRESTVKIFEIDWRNRTNIILQTELGIVHLGPYSSQFAEQLEVLHRLRALPTKLKTSQIAYIDLKNPESPALQMIQSYPKTNPNLPLKTPSVPSKLPQPPKPISR
ncbi:cell division protein FtsQ/DivIB [Microseira wollei]|uniref:Polypeptide-transport-associated domain-containing protein FtsQ-type n=1 Tax=Microseira wollei NIES-4236 TaxID=2530354 RepID=A0AAV3XIA0_9CYAN|nr:FtsQ-type POTRA domain-containing protein [Microseira wollei]GET39865.1 polypeptide-transport-associated domain-containing protein FtsQ-type [Microseira wollei NIES-4236]